MSAGAGFVGLALAAAAVFAAGAAAAISATGTTFSATAGQPVTTVVATFSDDQPQPASNYPATIAWGDGTVSAGTVTCPGCPNSPQYQVTGTHTYGQPGPYATQVTVTNNQTQQTATAHGSAQVAAQSGAPGAAFTISPDSPVSGQTLSFDASGSQPAPGTTFTHFDWSFDGAGAPLTCDGTAQAHRTYAEPGDHVITLTAYRSDGASSTVSHAITIADGGATTALPAAACGASPTAPLAPGLRGPPTVTITSPGDFEYYDRAPDPLSVSGTVRAPEGIKDFCLTGPRGTDAIPADCSQKSTLSKGTFNLPVLGARPGPNFIDAWVRDSVGQVAHAELVVMVATAATGIDLRTDAMEVTQGIQGLTLPLKTPQTYTGDGLAAGGKTVVRLWADAPKAPKLLVKGVDAALYGSRDGVSLPGSPLLAENGPLDLTSGTGYSGEFDLDLARQNPNGAYVFTLPESWTHGAVRLTGFVNPPDLPPEIAECTTCYGNDDFEISGVKFTPTRSFKIVSVKQIFPTGGLAIAPSASDAYAAARAVTPLGDGQLVTPPYAAVMDVSAALDDPEPGKYAKSLLFDWAIWQDYYDPSPPDTYIGVHANGIRGSTDGSPHAFFAHKGIGFVFKKIAQASYERPLNSLRHELGHIFDHPHASKGCGGDADGQIGEDWPDPEGAILGVGLDRRGDPSGLGPYRILFPGRAPLSGAKTAKGQYFDLMSYCAFDDRVAWTSTINWERELASFATGARRRFSRRTASATRATPGPSLLVSGFLDPDGTARLVSVIPAPAPGTPPSDSSIHLRLLDAAGRSLSETPMLALPSHEDDGGGPYTTITTSVAAGPGAQAVEVVRDGTVLARRVRSAHAPEVTLTSPRAGTRVGHRRRVTIRWRATDADQDPLTARVEYSPDGGSRWREVYMGPDTGSATVASRLLSASRRARVRVRVNDGFNETAVESGRFRALGAPPDVTITSPVSGQRAAADGALYLSGTAFDDTGRSLRGRRLRWLSGRRTLGRGEHVSVAGLRRGRRRIRLKARDAHGRTGTTSVVVRLRAARPHFLVLRVPRTLPPRARRVRMRVAATVPARLQVAGQRFRVARRASRLAVRVRPGRRTLHLRLRLTAGGPAGSEAVSIRRR